MARMLVMGDVVLRCQRRADMEGDQSLSLPEWQALISEQYGHIYSSTVKSGMRHFEALHTITANGAQSYPLPSGDGLDGAPFGAAHDQTIGIERQLDSTGRTAQLCELMIQERNAWAGSTGEAQAYSIVGQTIVLSPRPMTGTYLHTYVPQAPDLSTLADTSTFDVITSDGEAFLIWGVAVKALAKRQQDPSLHIAERNAAEERFVEDVLLRALVNPRRRVVMRSPGDWYDDDFGMGFDPASWRNR